MMLGYLFIAATVLLTVYGQLVLKWQVSQAGPFPETAGEQAWFILRLLLNPWVITALGAAFGASLFWMGAVAKFELSKAYPFMAANFILVGAAAVLLFGETPSWPKAMGVLLVTAGLIVMTRA